MEHNCYLGLGLITLMELLNTRLPACWTLQRGLWMERPANQTQASDPWTGIIALTVSQRPCQGTALIMALVESSVEDQGY